MRAPVLLAVLIVGHAQMARADSADDAAIAVFRAVSTGICMSGFNDDGTLAHEFAKVVLPDATAYGEADPTTLWQFTCNIGAYNVMSVFVAQGEISGLRPLAFVQPDLVITREDPDDPDSAPTSVEIGGWMATGQIVNAVLDPSSGRVEATAHWRGMGDASDSGVWLFKDGGYVLTHFEVDASYDEKVNPVVLLDLK